MINVTPVIEAVVALISAIVAVFIVPWIKSKTSEHNLNEFLKWVDIAVAAAEQIFDSQMGIEKKAYVSRFLREKGYTVNGTELDNAIESAVIKLHNELYTYENKK